MTVVCKLTNASNGIEDEVGPSYVPRALEAIQVRGSRVCNLKDLSVDIPRTQLVVVTGVSGSGKSSLAFGTVFAAAQCKYMESLSSYARQFLNISDKPDVDHIHGLSPAIAIQQKTTSHNPRSTVGTVTEIYDYMRLLYARAGIAYSPITGKPMHKMSVEQMVHVVEECLEQEQKFSVMAPVAVKTDLRADLEKLARQGYQRVCIDGHIHLIDEVPATLPATLLATTASGGASSDVLAAALGAAASSGASGAVSGMVSGGMASDMSSGGMASDMSSGVTALHGADLGAAAVSSGTSGDKHTLEVVIDRLIMGKSHRSRLIEAIQIALKYGFVIVKGGLAGDGEKILLSERAWCPVSKIEAAELDTTLFSFNSPLGACTACGGLGLGGQAMCDLFIKDKTKKILDENAFTDIFLELPAWKYRLKQACRAYRVRPSTTWNRLPKDVLDKMMLSFLKACEEVFDSNDQIKFRHTACTACQGQRLKPQALMVKVNGLNISQVTEMPLAGLVAWAQQVKLDLTTDQQRKIACPILKEIIDRTNFLINVGLGYLTLARSASTLSGGESQRIRLASQVGSSLQGIIYVLDEPSVGLHQKDQERLLKVLRNLVDIGNTVLVVEHDRDTINSADIILEIGPGAGDAGGRLVCAQTPSQIKRNKNSLTGLYLSGARHIGSGPCVFVGEEHSKWLSVHGASGRNLKNIDCHVPLGTLTCVSGISGSGKSTLIFDTLLSALRGKLHKAHVFPMPYHSLTGDQHIERIVGVTQKALGASSRSTPATYTGVFDLIRKLYSSLELSKIRGYKLGRFSYNMPDGRCIHCTGKGTLSIPMHFLSDVTITCEVCKGIRYNSETLEVKYDGHSIGDLLMMSVERAMEVFKNQQAIWTGLDAIASTGLGYLKLGQNSDTLSGGECQRIKIAAELSKPSTRPSLYVMDEPTTGLHFEDISKLLCVMRKLVEKGHTVLVIEHNIDFISNCDWVIDMGYEGGEGGGHIVDSGSVKDLIANGKGYTAHYLRKSANEAAKLGGGVDLDAQN